MDEETKKEHYRRLEIRDKNPKRSKSVLTRSDRPIGISYNSVTVIEFGQSNGISPKYWYKSNHGKTIECDESTIDLFWNEWMQNKDNCSYRKDIKEDNVFAFHQYNIKNHKIFMDVISSFGGDLKDRLKSNISMMKLNNFKRPYRIIISDIPNVREIFREFEDIDEIEIDNSISKEIFYIECNF